MPDIVAIAHSQYAWAYAVGPYDSLITPRPERRARGAHQLEGILLATGPGVAAQRDALGSLSIVDVAPTILHVLGVPVPSDMDGRVLTELFATELLESRPVRVGEPVGYWPDEHSVTFCDDGTVDRDHDEIRSRLRALGYVE